MIQGQYTIPMAIFATILIMLIVILERAFPFILFSKKDPPAIIRFVEKYIPPMVMAALVVYCLKDLQFTEPVLVVPTVAGIAVTALSFLWKHNSLISIFGGTIVYMVLMRIM